MPGRDAYLDGLLDDRFHEATQSLLSFRASHMIRTLEALD
jgi:hypothetical protein